MSIKIQTQRRFAEFSTFGIGGPIGYFIAVHTKEELKSAFSFCSENKLPFFILGKGSNCLFDDRGFQGVVIYNLIDHCLWGKTSVTVGSGYSFSLLGLHSAKRGLKGLEFASGIPASVGGAIFMNAGAHGGQTLDCLVKTSFMDPLGHEYIFTKDEIVFGYRHTMFHEMAGAIIEGEFELKTDLLARSLQKEWLQKRMSSQPLKAKSAGCVFRNPHSNSAAQLIDKAGLKGTKVGRASVSTLHANFIINEGGATFLEVQELIEIVQKRVYQTFEIALELEVRIVSF